MIFDTGKLLNIWHHIGVGVAGLGFITQQALPYVSSGATPKALGVVTALAAASVTATTIMSNVAKNAIVQSVVNSKVVSTPDSVTLPAADLK